MNGKRYFAIDILRGLAIIAMVLIHANAYFLKDKLAFWLWDINQFAVPAFIFCSVYVFYRRNNCFDLKKRVIRLIRPYYIFLIVFFLISWVGGKKFSLIYVVNSLTVTGGIDLNWLVLLFLMLSVVMAVIKPITSKQRLVFYAFTALSLFSSIILIFYRFPYNYRLIMWLPWSVLIILSWYFVKYEDKVWFLTAGTILSLLALLTLRLVNINIGHSLVQFDNKYPPNLYHISYGVFFIFIFHILVKVGVFNLFPVKNSLNFLSRYSYSLFFIHFLVIFTTRMFIKLQFNWWSFFGWVFGVSVAIQSVVSFFRHYIKARQFEY